MTTIAGAFLLVLAAFTFLLLLSIAAVEIYYDIRDARRCRRAERLEAIYSLPSRDRGAA